MHLYRLNLLFIRFFLYNKLNSVHLSHWRSTVHSWRIKRVIKVNVINLVSRLNYITGWDMSTAMTQYMSALQNIVLEIYSFRFVSRNISFVSFILLVLSKIFWFAAAPVLKSCVYAYTRSIFLTFYFWENFINLMLLNNCTDLYSWLIQ